MKLVVPSVLLFLLQVLGAKGVRLDDDPSFGEAEFNQAVTDTKESPSRSHMIDFVTGWCTENNFTIEDEVALEAFVKYFDTECDEQSYAAMTTAIHASVNREPQCGGGWVVAADATVTDGNSIMRLSKSTADGSTRLSVLAVAVLRKLQENRDDPAETPSPTAFHRAFILGLDGTIPNNDKLATFSGLHGDTTDFATLREEVCNDGAFGVNCEATLEPLDQAGYDSVVGTSDNDKMVVFIFRLADSLSLDVVDFGGLLGVAPWYSELCGPQTFDTLKKEMEACLDDPAGTDDAGTDSDATGGAGTGDTVAVDSVLAVGTHAGTPFKCNSWLQAQN